MDERRSNSGSSEGPLYTLDDSETFTTRLCRSIANDTLSLHSTSSKNSCPELFDSSSPCTIEANNDTVEPVPPPTDPQEIDSLWEQVRSLEQSSANAKTKFISHQTFGDLAEYTKSSLFDLGTEFQLRQISIVQSSVEDGESLLPPSGQDKLTEHYTHKNLRTICVQADSELISRLQDGLEYCMNPDHHVSKVDWVREVYGRFLPGPMKIDFGRTGITCRHGLPILCFKRKPQLATLLPPRVSVIEEFPNAPTRNESIERLKQAFRIPPITPGRITPDVMYAPRREIRGEVKNTNWHLSNPTVRILQKAYFTTSPYLIGNFRTAEALENEAFQHSAYLGSLLLLERVKLRSMSSNSDLEDIKLYTITCCASLVKIHCMMFSTVNVQAGEALQYQMKACGSYRLMFHGEVTKLVDTLNRIHMWGRTEYIRGLDRDHRDAKKWDNLDDSSYRYKDPKHFEKIPIPSTTSLSSTNSSVQDLFTSESSTSLQGFSTGLS